MNHRTLTAAALLSLAAALPARATVVDVTDLGTWQIFDVADVLAADGGLGWIDIADGSTLTFDFSVASGQTATLTVVDAGYAGDRFLVTSGTTVLGQTSMPGDSYPADVGLDFDAALADARYSRGVFTLGAGSYSVTGYLTRSVAVGGVPLNTTVGALKLDVSPVPEPSALALLLAGLGAVGFVACRRAA